MKHVYDPNSQREKPSRTLDKRYPIQYPRPSKVPIQLILKGNSVRIRVFVRYSAKMFRYYPGSNITYADVAEAGIRRNWSGKYPMSWLEDDGYEMSRAHASYRVLTQDNNPLDEQIGRILLPRESRWNSSVTRHRRLSMITQTNASSRSSFLIPRIRPVR